MIYRRLSLLALLLPVLVSVSFSQQTRVDSLLTILPQHKQDSNRAYVLAGLSESYRACDLKQAKAFGDRAVALAEELRSPRVLAHSYTALGWAHEALRDNAQAKSSFETALKFAREAGDGSAAASAVRGLGSVEYNRDNIEGALRHYRHALKSFRESGDEKGTALTLIDIGIVHRFQGSFDEALANFRQAQELGRSLGESTVLAQAHVHIGDIARRRSQSELAREHIKQGLQIFKKLGDSSGIASSITMLGSADLNQGRFESAQALFQRSLRLYENLGDASGMAIVLTYIGHLHNIQGRFDKALTMYRRGLALHDSLGSGSLVIGSLLSIGNILYQQSEYEQALEAFQRSLMLSEDLGMKGLHGSALIHIGLIQMNQDRDDQALEKFRHATQLFSELGDDGASALGQCHIGDIYARQGNYSEALVNYLSGLRAFEKNGDKMHIASTLHRIGTIYSRQGRLGQALVSLNRSLKLREEMDERSGIAEVLTDIGALYVKEGKSDSAIVLSTRAYKIAGEIGALVQQKDAAKTLSEAYAATRDFTRAYDYLLSYTHFNDSLFNVEKAKSINEMTAKYEAERREQKITLLEKDKLLQASLLERETLIRNVFVAGVVVLLLLTGLLLHRYLFKKRTSEQFSSTLAQLKQTQAQLIHAEKMVTLGEMTAGLAHEIKNPLNFVTNFSESATELLTDLEQSPDDDHRSAIVEELRGNLSRIKDHGNRADTIIQGMMLHARGVGGDRGVTDINALVEDAVQLAYHGMRATHPTFEVDLIQNYHPSALEGNVVPQEISRVMLNLINNAMYAVWTAPPLITTDSGDELSDGSSAASPSHERRPTIWIETASREDSIEIRIRDNGPGIPEDIQQKIFQPFFTTKPSGEGTGLGLSMSYDIITNGHDGSISCTSTAKGAEFVIELPK